MTAISFPEVPQQLDEKPENVEVKTGKLGCVFWATCGVFSSLTLVVIVAFMYYLVTIDIAPPCGKRPPPVRATDVAFKRNGKLSGTDVDFEEDCHYDHDQNTLVMKLTSADVKTDNATVIHDYSQGITTRVLEAHRRCYLGPLEIDDNLNLPLMSNGDIQELQSVKMHRYQTMGPIAPEYFVRTASPLVSDYCAGLQTSWIAPSSTVAAAGANPFGRRPVRELSDAWTIVGLPDGTVISDMTNRALLRLYGH